MDERRFDALARTVAGEASRRRVLRGLAGALLGAAAGAVGPSRAVAQTCRTFGDMCRSQVAGYKSFPVYVCNCNPVK